MNAITKGAVRARISASHAARSFGRKLGNAFGDEAGMNDYVAVLVLIGITILIGIGIRLFGTSIINLFEGMTDKIKGVDGTPLP